MIFYNFCYYNWGQYCWWTETNVIGNDVFLFFISLHCPQLFYCSPALPLLRRPSICMLCQKTSTKPWCANVNMTSYQACNQLRRLGGAKSFLRGPIFSTVSNSFKLCPTHFSRGAKKFSGGFAPPAPLLVTGLRHMVTSQTTYIQ